MTSKTDKEVMEEKKKKKDALDSEFQQFFFFLHSGKCSCAVPKMNQCDKEVERRNRWKGFLWLKF